MDAISRRTILTHGGLAAGAATAVGAGWSLTHPAVAGTTGPQQLHVPSLRILGPAQRLQVGATRTLQGILQLGPDTAAVGTFLASSVVLAEPDLIDPQVGFFETQLFSLAAGTISAVGTVHHTGRGEFTITGGTGRFVNLRGAYTSVQSADHSGLGTATFTFETTENREPWTPT